MRKLKLQMQLTLDGFVARPNGELDWMTWNWDDELKQYVNDLTDSIDTILLGRKMTDGFVSHWESIVKNHETKSNKGLHEEYEFAKKMVDTPKVVFSKTLTESRWANTILAKGDLSDEINRLKNQKGKDIIAYGGAGFVSNLIKEGLIDDYYLFVNPIAIGVGMTIFNNVDDKLNLKLVEAKEFDCGIVLLHYREN